MNVLFAASECAPFIKTGGLADVVAALPKALAAKGLSVRVLIPAYPSLAPMVQAGKTLVRYEHLPGGAADIVAYTAEGLDLLLLDAPHLFARPGNPYVDGNGHDYGDNHIRFGALSKAAGLIAQQGLGGWKPHILHAHDWQAGLAPVYMRIGEGTAAKAVTTIHNIAFQGCFPGHALRDLWLPLEHFHRESFEYYGAVSFLKGGLMWSDRITTVSPTYAREITTPTYGLGFEGILAARREHLTGILNGVDLDVWDPATDPSLAKTYKAGDTAGRAANRRRLLDHFGLSMLDDAPLFCIVTRLTAQKGVDLLLGALPRLLAHGAGLVALGSGDPRLEMGLRAAAHHHPQRVGVKIGYDEGLSHLMQGGADVIIIPSRFEPCGLTQLYGLRYGCLPLVARTGGLADTVIDANEAALTMNVATGFQFSPVTQDALGDAVDRACEAFADKMLWRTMMDNAMDQPVGWDRSADAYRALYEDALG